MATPNDNSPQILRDEILADALRQSEEITRRARQEADALLAKAAAEADKTRQKRLDQASAEAALRKALILATVQVETDRLRSARVEALLESIREETRRRLNARDGFDYRDALVTLAADAVKHMHGKAFVVKLSSTDRAAFGDELAGDILRRVERAPLNLTISNDATLNEGGVIIEDNEGHQVWDNRLLTRLDRLWPQLRRQIAVQTGLVAEDKLPGDIA